LIGDTASTRVLFRNAHARWPDVVNIEEPWIARAVELGKLYGANTEGMWRATPWGLRPTRQTFAWSFGQDEFASQRLRTRRVGGDVEIVGVRP
jgi:hypothetical protein